MNALPLMIFRVMISLSVVLLVIGIFKPEWLCFRKKQPDRITIITIIVVAIGILMIGVIGAGTFQYAGRNNAEAVNRGKMLGEAEIGRASCRERV